MIRAYPVGVSVKDSTSCESWTRVVHSFARASKAHLVASLNRKESDVFTEYHGI